MTYLAHITRDAYGHYQEQTVAEHCRNCARYAAQSGVPELEHTAYLAGLLHDMGKYSAAFQDYLEWGSMGEAVRRGSVNHTFASVRFAMERWHTGSPSFRTTVCEIIAVAAGAHHGLFDCIDPDGKDGFLHRMTKEGIGYEEAKEQFLLHCAGLDELDKLFDLAVEEFTAVIERCKPSIQTEDEMRFTLALLSRMILSLVIDGDRRDTAQFMLGADCSEEKRDFPQLWRTQLEVLESKLAQMPADTPMNRIRGIISTQCRQSASCQPGIYRLSVPTGGGKTLSSLRYALAAAAEHKKKRIFFVIPLLSILEQNAAVIREFIADDSLILEHHSNLVREQTTLDERNDNEFLMETWDVPIVITTLVQLLNTLFLGKTSSIRRMHALADSIIIIDEVQSIPRKLLSLFNMAMNYLAAACHTTVILCSATQPCLENIRHALHYQEPPDLISIDPKLLGVFSRTEIIDKRKKGGCTVEELTEFSLECMVQQGSLLIICNTKAQARALYTAVSQISKADVFHLSTAMCMEHRIQTLAQISACLSAKQPVVCISTQLVEAGVDFSFACVIRISAGLDNIIQAAGRCNRSGEFGRLCPVYIVNVHKENLSHLEEISQSQQAAEAVLYSYNENSAVYEYSLTSQASMTSYYRRLYTEIPSNTPDYPLPSLDTKLFSLLARNSTCESHSPSKRKYIMTQAFQTAGSEFHVFDDNTVDVLVPYGEGEGLVADLHSEAALHNLHYRKELVDKAKRFTISLYEYEIKQLEGKNGLVRLFEDSIFTLHSEFYSSQIGFDSSGTNMSFMEV
ncbi:MAG: CRISPR-associated helicase Cas3' [Clostridiales bacterium]|nr:CRISPR-associated helicase Cas3' [Clostridiales bacterium]